MQIELPTRRTEALPRWRSSHRGRTESTDNVQRLRLTRRGARWAQQHAVVPRRLKFKRAQCPGAPDCKAVVRDVRF